MLFPRLKSRRYNNSQASLLSQNDSAISLFKNESIDIIDMPNNNIINKSLEEVRDEISKRFEKALYDSKKDLSINKTTNNTSLTNIPQRQGNPFKKKVDEYFRKREYISLQQKLRALAPTTINNITLAKTRHNPSTNKSFLATPYDTNSELEKRLGTSNEVTKARNSRLAGVKSQPEWLGLREENDSMCGNILYEASYKKKEANSSVSPDKTEMDTSNNCLNKSAFVASNNEKETKRAVSSQQNPRNLNENRRKRRKEVVEEQNNFNFKASSAKCLQVIEEGLRSKEGSVLKYLRAQRVPGKSGSAVDISQEQSNNMGSKYVNISNTIPKEGTGHHRPVSVGWDPRNGEMRKSHMRYSSMADSSFEGDSVGESSRMLVSSEDRDGVDKYENRLKKLDSAVQVTKERSSMSSQYKEEERRMHKRSNGSVDMVRLQDEEWQQEDFGGNDLGNKEEVGSKACAVNRLSSGSFVSFAKGRRSSCGESIEQRGVEVSKEKWIGSVKMGESIMRESHQPLVLTEKSKATEVSGVGDNKEAILKQLNGLVEYAKEKSKMLDMIVCGRTRERMQRKDSIIGVEANNGVNESSRVKAREGTAQKMRRLNELTGYTKERSKKVEAMLFGKAFAKLARRGTSDLSFNEAENISDMIKVRGGIEQTTLGLQKEHDVPAMFQEDFVDAKKGREEAEELSKHVETIRHTKEQLWVQQQRRLEQAKIVVQQRLTNSELESIKQEFCRLGGVDPDNVERIDRVLKRLKFFSQLDYDVRIDFYQSAKYLSYQKGTYIFRQGEMGDYMYVILRGRPVKFSIILLGNVNVKTQKKFRNGQSQFVTVYSLNDGTHFGDLGFMGVRLKIKDETPQKSGEKSNTHEKIIQPSSRTPSSEAGSRSTPQSLRATSTQCAEETDLLAINRERFQEILFSVMHKDVGIKIKTLQLTPFFKREDAFNLMPIANLLKTKRFKFSQRIIKEKEIITGFYIVSQGRCKVVSEMEDGYDLDVFLYKEKLKPFVHDRGSQKHPQTALKSQEKKKDKSDPSMILFQDDPLNLLEEKDYKEKAKKFIKNIYFKELLPGDCFGFRSLLNSDEDATKENQAKLSIITESPVAELFYLPRESLMLVPEAVRNKLLEGISNMQDFDEFDFKKEIEGQQIWRDYKLDLIKESITKPDHPNLKTHKEAYKST